MTEAYLSSVKNLGQMLHAIKNAQAPPKFTTRFLEGLDFKSAKDRLFIGMLKGIGFLNAEGEPQKPYFDFLDDTQSKVILGEAIKKAYAELFQTNIKAYDMSSADVKNKLKTIFQGTKHEDVLAKMATTFKALCSYAEFSKTDVIKKVEEPKKEEAKSGGFFTHNNFDDPNLIPLVQKNINTELHYNIQIHLPETRDITVYDAIFKSLKEHLL